MTCKCEEIKRRIDEECYDRDKHKYARCSIVIKKVHKMIKESEPLIRPLMSKSVCVCPICASSLCDWCDTIENFGEEAKEYKCLI